MSKQKKIPLKQLLVKSILRGTVIFAMLLGIAHLALFSRIIWHTFDIVEENNQLKFIACKHYGFWYLPKDFKVSVYQAPCASATKEQTDRLSELDLN
jgi:hypothetical protein